MGVPIEKFPWWPSAMNRATALAYLQIAPKLFDQLEKTGGIAGKRLGPSGQKIYAIEQLDAVRQRLFGGVITNIDDEFEGIGG